jgi:hypothetical protein
VTTGGELTGLERNLAIHDEDFSLLPDMFLTETQKETE